MKKRVIKESIDLLGRFKIASKYAYEMYREDFIKHEASEVMLEELKKKHDRILERIDICIRDLGKE